MTILGAIPATVGHAATFASSFVAPGPVRDTAMAMVVPRQAQGRVLFLTAGAGSSSPDARLGAERFVSAWQARHPTGEVVHRELLASSPPRLGTIELAELRKPSHARGPSFHAAFDRARSLLAELQAADVLVISVTVDDGRLPDGLLGWIDHVFRHGETFVRSEGATKGTLGLKEAYIFAEIREGRPGVGAPPVDWDRFSVGYVRTLVEMMGVPDVQVIEARPTQRREAA